MEKRNEIRKRNEKVCNEMEELRDLMANELTEIVKERGEINLVDDDDFDYSPIYITYDGGSHPEYQSTLFSEVFNVKMTDKGVLVAETEDAEIEIATMTYIDVLEIYDAVVCIVENEEDEDEDSEL